MIDWIPTPGNGEGGRLPTAVSAHTHENHNGSVLWQFPDGTMATSIWDTQWGHPKPIAWMTLPAPYVPPPEPEKPKRKADTLEFDEFGRPMLPFCFAGGKPHSKIKITEVLDGDCCPDGARQVLEQIKQKLEMNPAFDTAVIGIRHLQDWLELLKGGDA